MRHNPSIDDAMNVASRALGTLLAIGLLMAATPLTGCVVAEKTRYVEHLSHVVEPAEEPDDRVIAAFQRERPGSTQPAMAAADERASE